MKILITSRGISLIEVIVGAAIIAASIVSIMGVYGGLSKLSYRNMPRLQATLLSEEGIEALMTMRDAGWTSKIASLTVGTTYHLYWTGNVWQATSSPATIDSTFDRTFVLSNIARDASFNIVSSGGTTDVNTRKVVVSVSWLDDTATSTKSMETYLSNTYNN